MLEGIWPALLVVLVVVVWTLSKVVRYARKSEQQWQDVDKSKLNTWEENEDD